MRTRDHSLEREIGKALDEEPPCAYVSACRRAGDACFPVKETRDATLGVAVAEERLGEVLVRGAGRPRREICTFPRHHCLEGRPKWMQQRKARGRHQTAPSRDCEPPVALGTSPFRPSQTSVLHGTLLEEVPDTSFRLAPQFNRWLESRREKNVREVTKRESSSS